MRLSAADRNALALAITLALAAALAAWLFVHRHYRAETVDEALSRLTLFHGLRKATLEDHMRSKASDVRAMSRNRRVVGAFRQFAAAWPEMGPDPAAALRQLYVERNPFARGQKDRLRGAGDDSAYTRAHQQFHDWARRFLDHFRYDDLYLIDRDGNILYTVQKDADFATNLDTGPYAESALGLVFQLALRKSKNKVTLSDFEHFPTRDDAPAAFAGTAIVGADGEVAGVFAVRYPGRSIDDILAYTAGMGETGQTYLVGNDLKMRSQSRFIDAPTMLRTVVDTEAVREALGGFSGSLTGRDYRGVRVLSVYSGLDSGGPPWVLIAERDEAEVLGQVPFWPPAIAALLAALIAGAAGHLGYRLYAGD
jgi:methyl-accepting chemotaxis protein